MNRWGHTCNAYCRGRIHSELVYCNADDRALASSAIARVLQRFALRLVRLRVATEAPRDGWRQAVYTFDEQGRQVPHALSNLCLDITAYLVEFAAEDA